MFEGSPGQIGEPNPLGQHDNPAEGLNASLMYTSGTGRANLAAQTSIKSL